MHMRMTLKKSPRRHNPAILVKILTKKKKKDTSAKPANKWCELHKNNTSHVNKDCFRHKKNVANTTNTPEISAIADEHAFFAFTQSEWILHSGAIKHVCCQKSFFDKIKFLTCV